MTQETTPTELPDGSGCFTATIMSHEEAMALPSSKRPLNYRISSDLYNAVFEAVGTATNCWNPKPDDAGFDFIKAEKIAVVLCFKIADELERVKESKDRLLSLALRAICLTRDYVGDGLMRPFKGWDWFDAGMEISAEIPDDEWSRQFHARLVDESKASGREETTNACGQ